MKQFLIKALTAWKFRKITFAVLRLRFFEHLNTLYLGKGWRDKPFSLPQSLVLRTTERCFLKCKMCGQNGEKGRLKDKGMIDRTRIDGSIHEKIVDEVSKWRFKPLVKYTGGEPLLEWKTLKPSIVKLSNAGCIVKLNSNGVLLKKKDLAEDIVKSGVHYLSVSVDGNKKVHNEIRGVATAFDDTKQGIANVVEARKKFKSKYPLILVSCVVSTTNEDKISSMGDLANEWGIDWLNIQFLNYLTPERTAEAHKEAQERLDIEEQPWEGFEIPELTPIDPEKLEKTIKYIKRTAKCTVSTMNIGGMTAENIRKYYYTDDILHPQICHMPSTTAFIVPPGKMTFCIDYPFYDYCDLAEKGLAEGWFGEKAARFRTEQQKYYQETGKNFPHCQRCNWPYN